MFASAGSYICASAVAVASRSWVNCGRLRPVTQSLGQKLKCGRPDPRASEPLLAIDSDANTLAMDYQDSKGLAQGPLGAGFPALGWRS